MYDISIIHQLEWPSLTVQWLGEVEMYCILTFSD